MVHFASLDVSVKATSVCAVDESAEIIAVLDSLGVPFLSSHGRAMAELFSFDRAVDDLHAFGRK